MFVFFFSSRRRHTRYWRDWSSDVCSSDLLRRQLTDAEKDGVRERSASRRAEAAVSLEALRIGDVIRIPAGRRAGWAVVVQPARTGKGSPTGPAVVTEDRQFRRLTLVDVPDPVAAVTHVKVPPH